MWNATQPCGEPAPDMTLITGTGRAGTSFLIALLTRLGLPTGYGETDVRTAAARRSHAGLERSIRMCRDERNRSVAVDAANGSVRVVKSPWYAAPELRPHWLTATNIRRVVVPLRELKQVARSRERHAHGNGGFWRGAENADAQQRKDAELLAGLFYDLEMADKATTTLAFPRSARDEAYCRAKLGWLLDEYGVDARAFNRSYRATANRSMTRDRDRAPPPEPTFWWSGYDHANWTWPAWQGWNATRRRPRRSARPARAPGARASGTATPAASARRRSAAAPRRAGAARRGDDPAPAEDGNLLLCTLLLGNTLVNAMIAILLSDMTSGVVGGLVTTALIVVFGEIIPQSVCSRYALRIGARSVPLVWLFVGVCFAAAYPIAKLLDYVLGGEMSAVFTKNELKSLILLNVEDPKRQAQSGLTSEDGRILAGALTFKDRKVADVMTPLDSTFALPRNAVLSAATVAEILRSGHTRIPVVLPDNAAEVVALLYAKDLVGIGYERKIPLQQVLDSFRATERVHSVAATTTLGAAFDLCKSKRCHMRVPPASPEARRAARATPRRLVVVDKAVKNWPCLGVVTTEDILEELIQDEIVGDDDQLYDDAAASSQRPGLPRKNSMAYDPTLLLKELAGGPSGFEEHGDGIELAPRGSDTLFAGCVPGF
ncbi:DUF21-containing protein [Aureococcus anophagefferens]|nr:DUF21-containing protein [Aureococcus anophagefferens]